MDAGRPDGGRGSPVLCAGAGDAADSAVYPLITAKGGSDGHHPIRDKRRGAWRGVAWRGR